MTTEKSYRMEFDTQAEAQAMADKLHGQLIASSPTYAGSVTKGGTLRWAIPMQDMAPDDPAKPFGPSHPVGKWWITVPDYGTRDALKSLTAGEQTKLEQAGKDAVVAATP